jgi:tRNA-2-methylthio-N6-dimethylallyladenosine synthase
LEAAEQGRTAVETDEKPAFAFSSSHLEEGLFRTFIPIMHGCNNFCSYCIVPYVRGREISRSPVSILDEIRMAGEKGVKEITLLGQNVNSYQYSAPNSAPDTNVDFPHLLELVAEFLEKENSPIRWVRFLSSHPKDLSPEAIRVMAGHKVFCRHLHLCVQHGSNSVLKAMNRRYTREQYLELVSNLRTIMPDITLSTDILIGFPGETEQDFEDTLSLMEEVKFQYAYTYHYNPREGTAAYDLPNRVPDKVKRERLAAVIKLQQKHTAILLRKRIGTETMVLIEGISHKNADELIARTDKDEMVVVPGNPAWFGRFGRLVLSALRGVTFRAGEIELINV